MSDEDQPRLVQEHPLAALPPESSSGTNTISRSPSSSSSSSATSSKTSLWNYATDIERTVNAIVSHGAFPPSVYRALTAQQESVIKIDESLATHATEPLASLRLPVHLHDHTNESLAKAASSSSSRKSDSDSTDDETLSSMPSREASGKIWRRSSAPTTGQDWIIKLVNEAIARQQLEQLSQANADTTTATSNSTSTNSINHSSPNDLIAQEPEPLDRDWHDEFQALRSRYRAHNLVGSSNAALEAVKQIQYLQQEFDLEAQHTASTIIAERNREQKLRTIKQLNGLEHHYYHNGIFYRVVVDSDGSFGGDLFATKAAGLERITLLFAFIASQIDLSKELAGDPRKAALREMRFPLYALVDVGGYRVIAVSKLPVEGPETLAYGSNNASSSSFEFCSSDINAENVARLLCEQMHIKKHKIQTASETVSIWGCYDLEIHRDADGQYYFMNGARLLPPLAPRFWHHRAEVICRYRPEFVRRYAVVRRPMLNPDAFSFWSNQLSVADPTAPVVADCDDLKTAAIFFNSTVLPECAKHLDTLRWIHFSMGFHLHACGVNICFLGMVRNLCTSEKIRALCLLEMCARVIKDLIREIMKRYVVGGDEQEQERCKQTIADLLNVVFGVDETRAQLFWQARIKDLIVKKFVGFKSAVLSAQEQQETHDLRHSLVRSLPRYADELLRRICYWCGLALDFRPDSELRAMFRHVYDVRPRFDDDSYERNYGDDDVEVRTDIDARRSKELQERLDRREFFTAANIVRLDPRVKGALYTQFERGYCELESACSLAGIRWEDSKLLMSGLELVHVPAAEMPDEQRANAIYLSTREAIRSLGQATHMAPFDVQAWDLFTCGLMILAQIIPFTYAHTSRFATESLYVQREEDLPGEWFSPYPSIGELIRVAKYMIEFYKKMGLASSTRATEMRIHNVKLTVLEKQLKLVPDPTLIKRGDEWQVADVNLALKLLQWDATNTDLLKALLMRQQDMDPLTYTRICVFYVRYAKPLANCRYWAKVSDTLMSLGMHTAAIEAFRLLNSESASEASYIDENAYGTFENGHLSLVNQELDEVPYLLGNDYGDMTTTLDMSFNNLKHINHLENFVKLSCLILDNNRIVADQSCTPVPSLRTLSVNNNEIEELGVFIEHIATIFPNLRHLSMLRNPAVPSPFIEGAYQEYRQFVISRFPKLEFLDSSAVTGKDRANAPA